METFGTAQGGRMRREGRMDLPSSRTPVQVRRTVRSGMRGERTNAESPARQNGRGRGRNPEQELGLRGFHCCERRRRCLCPRSRSQRAPGPHDGPQHAHRLQPASRVSRTRREMSALRKGPRERAGVRCNALRRLSRASRRGKPTAVCVCSTVPARRRALRCAARGKRNP